MNILLLCNRIPYPPNDGGAIAIYNMIKGLHHAGAKLDIFSLNTKKHFVELDKLPEDFRSWANLTAVNIDTSIKALDAFFNLFTRQSYNIVRFHQLHVEQELTNLLQRKHYDIVHIEGLFMLPYIPIIRKYSKAKIVFRAHNIESQIWERLSEKSNPIKKWYLSLLARRLRKFELIMPGLVDLIVPISNEDAVFFQNAFPSIPIYVSAAGVDLEKFKPNSSKIEDASIFHLGALNWMPNLEAVDWFLEHVYPILKKNTKNFNIYIAGKDTPESFYEKSTGDVHILGEVDNAVDFMNSKKIMVVPLFSGSGMRLKIVEGLALGKVIVSTTVGAEGINYTNNKNILIADNPEDFAEKILNLLDNNSLYNEISNAAIELANNEYDNMQIVKRLFDYYRQI